MTTVAEFDHIWPFDSVTLQHAPCVRCDTAYGPDAGMCRAVYPGGEVPRCILTWPHPDRLHEDFDGDRWGTHTQPSDP